MQNTLSKLLLVSAIAAVTSLGADNSLGTWKLNVETSKSSSATFPLKSLTTTREAADGGVRVTTTGQRADGTLVNVSYTEKYDGTTSPFKGSGAPYDAISIKQVNASTFTDEQRKTGGSYHTTGRTVISKDGRTMTVTRKGTSSDGTAFTATYVYEKHWQ